MLHWWSYGQQKNMEDPLKTDQYQNICHLTQKKRVTKSEEVLQMKQNSM